MCVQLGVQQTVHNQRRTPSEVKARRLALDALLNVSTGRQRRSITAQRRPHSIDSMPRTTHVDTWRHVLPRPATVGRHHGLTDGRSTDRAELGVVVCDVTWRAAENHHAGDNSRHYSSRTGSLPVVADWRLRAMDRSSCGFDPLHLQPHVLGHTMNHHQATPVTFLVHGCTSLWRSSSSLLFLSLSRSVSETT